MAFEIPVLLHTLESSGGSKSDQFKAVNASTAGGILGGYRVVSTLGGRWTGVLQENSTEVVAQRVMSYGISKVAATGAGTGGAITEGSVVVASANGEAVPSTAGGQYALGIALQSLSTAGTGVIPVLLTPGALST